MTESKLPSVYFGRPGRLLDWRAARVDDRDDDELRPMTASERRLLKLDPVQLLSRPDGEEPTEEKAVTGRDQFDWLAEKLRDLGIPVTVDSLRDEVKIGRTRHHGRLAATIAMLRACQEARVAVPDWVRRRPDDMR